VGQSCSDDDITRLHGARVAPSARRSADRQPNSFLEFSVRPPRKGWTVGWVAVTGAEMREIWSLVPTGARIVIHP
jgi:hypothetical protein